jgi:cold shock CspA family protein
MSTVQSVTGAPSRPPAEVLEAAAASPRATPEGARWVTARTAEHLLNAATPRDPHTGVPLPIPLRGALDALDGTLLAGDHPLAADRLQSTAEFVAGPLRNVLRQPRTRVARDHVLMPPHRLRGLDAKCVTWLGRQPGRTVREKLASRPTALGVVHDLTLDTQENRLVGRLVRLLGRLLTARFRALGAGGFDPPPAGDFRFAALQRCRALCEEEFARSEIVGLPPGLSAEPNNVLLGDRDYSRLWRAWRWLSGYEASASASWRDAEERYRTAVFWALVARLAHTPGVWMCDAPARIDPGDGESGFGIATFAVEGTTGDPIWRSEPLAGMVVEPPPPPSGWNISQIRRLRDTPQGRHGFIVANGERDHYFDERDLRRGLTWDGLREGQRVVFLPGQGPKGPQAQQVALAPTPTLVWLFLKDHSLHVFTWPLDGEGVLAPVEAAQTRSDYTFRTESRKLEARRGLALEVDYVLDGQFKSVERVRHADLRGTRDLANRIARRVTGTAAPAATAPPPPIARVRFLGLDPVTVLPRVDADGVSLEVRSALYAVKYRTPGKGESALWMAGRADRWLDSATRHAGTVVAADGLSADPNAPPGDVAVGCGKMLEALRDELSSSPGLRPDACLAFAVPDTMEAFSGPTLPTAARTAFGRAFPVWRSVALAMGWQQAPDFASAGVAPGDVVLVIDAAPESMAMTFLVARHDDRLEQSLPATQGLYWERRACLSRLQLSEALGDLATELSHSCLLTDYVREALRPASDVGQIGGETVEALVERLSRSGVAEAALFAGRSAWIPLGAAAPDRVVHLPSDTDGRARCLRRWGERFRGFLRAVSVTTVFQTTLQECLEPGRSCHLLLAGLPFCLPGASDTQAVEAAARGTERWRAHLPPASEGFAAAGARHFLERRESGLPSWDDWLPELYLEVIRSDGLMHELQLMGQELLRDEATGALGRPVTYDVPDTLQLRAGEEEYRFPLLLGQRRQPLRYDAALRAPGIFPLVHDVEVRLRLEYRYGSEKPYELLVTPLDPASAPFRRLSAVWARQPVATSDAPRIPGRWFWDAASLGEMKEWFLGKATELTAKVETFFGGAPDAAARLHQFALDMTGHWNRRPGAVPRPMPESTEDDLRFFAEWMDGALEVPMRRLWDRCRAPADDPAVADALADGFLDSMAHLAGLRGGGKHLDEPNEGGSDAETLVRGTALRLLGRLRQDAPPELLPVLGRILRNPAAGDGLLADALDAATFMVGDGTGPQTDCLRALLALVRQSTPAETRIPAARALASALWRYAELPRSLSDADPGFVEAFFDDADQTLDDMRRRLAAADDATTEDCALGFVPYGEILLALLSLRATADFRRLPRAGSPRLLRLAWLVRRVDATLADRGADLRSGIRLRSRKPETLTRMSDLAYTLHCYLTGNSACNLIQIAPVGEDEGQDRWRGAADEDGESDG